MHTFIMHTRYSRNTLVTLQTREEVQRQVVDRIRSECPQLEWINVAILSPYDHLDVFGAPSMDIALKAATLTRTLVSAHTEVWPATELGESEGTLCSMPKRKE